MMNDYDKQLMTQPFNKGNFREYRRIFKQLHNRDAPTCDCDAGSVYNAIKQKMISTIIQQMPTTAIIETKTQDEEMNTNVIKDPNTGKFVKKDKDASVTNTDNLTEKELESVFVRTVKQELYEGYNDLERIRQAYSIVIGNNNYPNIIAMKRVIMSYAG